MTDHGIVVYSKLVAVLALRKRRSFWNYIKKFGPVPLTRRMGPMKTTPTWVITRCRWHGSMGPGNPSRSFVRKKRRPVGLEPSVFWPSAVRVPGSRVTTTTPHEPCGEALVVGSSPEAPYRPRAAGSFFHFPLAVVIDKPGAHLCSTSV